MGRSQTSKAVASVCNMTRRMANVGWCMAFIVVGLMGVILGRHVGESKANLDFSCDGESAHRIPGQTTALWLTTRFKLNFSPEGTSHMRLVSQVIDADTGIKSGTQHRNSAFESELNGSHLLVNVIRGERGGALPGGPELYDSLGMFIFQSESNLSYWIRSWPGNRYLIDDGNDMFILCSRERPIEVQDRP